MVQKVNLSHMKDLYEKYVLKTYTKTDLCLVKGKDAFAEDINGKVYLDFFPGWVVSGLGHRNKYVMKNLHNQLKRILHVSNNYYNELQGELSKAIIKDSFKGRFFTQIVVRRQTKGQLSWQENLGTRIDSKSLQWKNLFMAGHLLQLRQQGRIRLKKVLSLCQRGFGMCHLIMLMP